MAIRNILVIDRDDVLRKHARRVEKFDDRLSTLLDDMAETMVAGNGVGLAAPQVGVLKRCCVIDVGEGLIELVNPEITAQEGEVTVIEGCLSVPDRAGRVVRPEKVTVHAQDRHGAPFDPTDEDLENAIRTTSYGKCVFKCNNDVVDHQVVNLEFEGGVICSFTMSAFNKGGRQIRIMGTKGELIGDAQKPFVTYHNFLTGESEEIKVDDQVRADNITGGHGGGDTGIMYAFYDMLSGKINPELSNIEISVKNHMIAFAAEKSRLEGRVVSLDEYN
jgi:peptide deformylase